MLPFDVMSSFSGGRGESKINAKFGTDTVSTGNLTSSLLPRLQIESDHRLTPPSPPPPTSAALLEPAKSGINPGPKSKNPRKAKESLAVGQE